MTSKLLPRTNDQRTEFSADLAPFHIDEDALHSFVATQLSAAANLNCGRRRLPPRQHNKPYLPELRQQRLQLRLLIACVRVWGRDTNIEWSPLTLVPTNYWVSPNLHACQVGAKPTLLTLHPEQVCLFGMWRLGPPTPTVDFRRIQEAHVSTSALFSAAPVRVLICS